jgi:hypothetical protein
MLQREQPRGERRDIGAEAAGILQSTYAQVSTPPNLRTRTPAIAVGSILRLVRRLTTDGLTMEQQ